jgi:hypothetical protein
MPVILCKVPAILLKYPLFYVKYQLFYVKYPLFYVKYPLFYVKYPLFYVQYPLFYVKYPLFYVKYQLFYVKCPLFYVKYPLFYVKYPLFLSDFNGTWIFWTQFLRNTQKIRPARVESILADRQTDFQTWWSQQSRSAVLWTRLPTLSITTQHLQLTSESRHNNNCKLLWKQAKWRRFLVTKGHSC